MKSFAVSLMSAVAAARCARNRVAQYYFRRHGRAVFPRGRRPLDSGGKVTEFTGFGAGNKIRYDRASLDAACGYVFNHSCRRKSNWADWQQMDACKASRCTIPSSTTRPSWAVTLQYRFRARSSRPTSARAGGSATFSTPIAFQWHDHAVRRRLGRSVRLSGVRGVRFDLNERMSVGIRYKYFATEDSSPLRFSLRPDCRLGIRACEPIW